MGKSNPSVHRYICAKCNSSFGNRQHLYRHKLKCIQLVLFNCKDCGKSFDRKDNLNRHIKICKGKNKRKCDICGSEFLRFSNLKRHLVLVHTEKDLSCDTCGKCYTRKDHYNTHMLTCNGSLEKKKSTEKKKKGKAVPKQYDLSAYQLPKDMDDDVVQCMISDYLDQSFTHENVSYCLSYKTFIKILLLN